MMAARMSSLLQWRLQILLLLAQYHANRSILNHLKSVQAIRRMPTIHLTLMLHQTRQAISHLDLDQRCQVQLKHRPDPRPRPNAALHHFTPFSLFRQRRTQAEPAMANPLQQEPPRKAPILVQILKWTRARKSLTNRLEAQMGDFHWPQLKSISHFQL